MLACTYAIVLEEITRSGLPDLVWSSPSLQHGHHPSCNRPRTLTAATGRCSSEPFASVIGAAEVPAGPVQRQIRLNEIELNSIKSNPIALNSIKWIIQFVANLFRFHHPSIHHGFDRSIFVHIFLGYNHWNMIFNAQHFPRLLFCNIQSIFWPKFGGIFRIQPCSVNVFLIAISSTSGQARRPRV